MRRSKDGPSVPNRDQGASHGQADSQAAREAPVPQVRTAREGADEQGQEGTGNYPIPDKGHAISAKRLSRKQRKDGKLTKDEFDRINRKADKVLHLD